MIRKYTHWFLMGGVLCTDTTDNESMSAAANMFSADIKGITVPGYTVVPDSEIADKARLFAERESIKRVANDLASENVSLKAELSKCRAAFCKQRNEFFGVNNYIYTGPDEMFKDPEGEDDDKLD